MTNNQGPPNKWPFFIVYKYIYLSDPRRKIQGPRMIYMSSEKRRKVSLRSALKKCIASSLRSSARKFARKKTGRMIRFSFGVGIKSNFLQQSFTGVYLSVCSAPLSVMFIRPTSVKTGKE